MISGRGFLSCHTHHSNMGLWFLQSFTMDLLNWLPFTTSKRYWWPILTQINIYSQLIIEKLSDKTNARSSIYLGQRIIFHTIYKLGDFVSSKSIVYTPFEFKTVCLPNWWRDLKNKYYKMLYKTLTGLVGGDVCWSYKIWLVWLHVVKMHIGVM